MVAIMVVGLFGTSFVSNTEAIKGKGVGISQYGSDTDICGLMPCSDYPGGKDACKAVGFKCLDLQNLSHSKLLTKQKMIIIL